MNRGNTAEFVRKGHPDRVCDILSDAIVDEYLKQDPDSRVAVDIFGCHGVLTIGGEITSNASVNIQEVVKAAYKQIGYDDEIGIQVNVIRQSPEIKELANEGAGDSGIVVGFATPETKEMLPLEVVLAKKICERLDKLIYLKPDGKVQVTLNGKEIEKLVVSVHGDQLMTEDLRKLLQNEFPHKDLFLTVYEVGGFVADSGLTGRKNVLWYGPRIPTGGGAFAGKDPTKVDRSGAYCARALAIRMAKERGIPSTVEIAYAIGKNDPVYIKINGVIQDWITLVASDYSVSGMLERLDLKKPVYRQASILGHFGTDFFPWDK